MKKILGYSKYVVVPGSWVLENIAVADAVTYPSGAWGWIVVGILFVAASGTSYLAYSGKW